LVYSEKPQLLQKNLSNVLDKLLAENKAEIRNSGVALGKRLFGTMGKQIVDLFGPKRSF
jgi:hypothetical protein